MSTESDVDDPDGVVGEAAEVEVPDELRRRAARKGPDGKTIEVLAARRGVMLRHDVGGGGSGGGDSILGAIAYFVLELIFTLLLNMFLQVAATGHPWKVKAYRLHGPFPRRIHSERLPAGVEPHQRMAELLDQPPHQRPILH